MEEEESEEEASITRSKVHLLCVCGFHLYMFCLLNVYSLTLTLPH